MTNQEFLDNIRELIKSHTNWCKESLAKDNDDNAISPESEGACAWCLSGAIIKVAATDDSFNFSSHPIQKALTKAIAKTGWDSSNGIPNWNDNAETTHNDVLALIESARSFLEKE